MHRARKIRWWDVFWGVVIGIIVLGGVFALWYWAEIWLPQKESRAMQQHFEIVEEQWLLQRAAKEATTTPSKGE